MKTALLFSHLFIFIQTIGYGQLCNPTYTATEIFYPNTTSTATNSGFKYLCGPNTVVYDTLNTGCKYHYVNAGSTLIFKVDPSCMLTSRIWLKNNSTLNIQQGNEWVSVVFEPLATIINTVGAMFGSNPCTSVTFPTVECSVADINEAINKPNLFRIWPTPSSNKINIEFYSSADIFADISINNHLGQIVSSFNQFPVDNKEIPIDNLSNGSYFLNFQTKSGRQTQKLIILR